MEAFMKAEDEVIQEASASRRSFLKKAGVAVALTPPAMTLLTKPSHATILKSVKGCQPCGQKRAKKRKIWKKKVVRRKQFVAQKRDSGRR
jgi:hypothetical protein